ncbi:hypothetical protein WJX77_004252 [Trebouxia sp. C0004]
MNSAFYTSSHSECNKQILHPAFIKLKIVQQMKGCATRVLRASTMCHLWHNEVPKTHTKELSEHDNNDAVNTLYNLKCPGNSLKTILRAAGFHMPKGDSWKDVFVPGRGLYTLERIQQERPDAWRSSLLSWSQVSKHGTALTISLSTGPVFLDLPAFQNAVFTDWLLGDFRQQILQLQLMADVCYKHIRDKSKENTKLEIVCSERPPPTSSADSQCILEDVFSRIPLDTDATAQAYMQQAQQATARAAEEELAAAAVPYAGDPGVAPGRKPGLKKLWLAWEPQQEGWACEGLRIYKAESPDLYPSDQRRRHQMR